MQFKHLIWNLNQSEIDLANILINIVERYEQFDIGHHTFDYKTPFYSLEINFHDLASSLGYLTLTDKTIQDITSTLDSLNKVTANIYYRSKNDRYMETTTFVFNYVISSIKRDLNKRLSVMLSTSLIKVLRENKDQFKKLYTYSKYEIRGKYSILLYDELVSKMHTNRKVQYEYSLDALIDLIDFELTSTSNVESWTKINSNVLSRAAKEINNKSPLHLDYEKVKEKITDINRTQTTGVNFIISQTPDIEAINSYFTDSYLMDKKVLYYMEKVIDRRVKQMNKFKPVSPNEEEDFRFKTRKELQSNRDEFEAQVALQEWVNWVKYNNHDEHGLVSLFDYAKHNYVTVNSQYKLMDIETNEILSTDAKDTRVKIQKFVNESDGEYGLVDVDYKKEYSISYTKG